MFFFFKQKTAYEMRISDWSSDVCSSDLEIELLEPTRDDTGVARFLESRGETLHHICFNTDDIEGELARLKGLEVDLIDETPRDGLAGKVAFIHPKAMHGVLIELAMPPAGAHVSPAIGREHG